MNPTPFSLRSSKIGYYVRCMRRLAYDRQVHDGLRQSMAGSSSPPADFGTCVHWHAQAAMRCDFKQTPGDFTFAGWNAGRATAAKYTDEQWRNGSSLFASETVAKDTLSKLSLAIYDALPDRSAKWMAESSFVCDGGAHGGHIDLLSADLEHLVDIKTTGTKPSGGRIKAAHLMQLLSYAHGVRKVTGRLPTQGHIIYAHNRGDWCFRSNPVIFADYADEYRVLQNLIAVGQIPALLNDLALPALSDDCATEFCDYHTECHRRLIPPGKAIHERTPDLVPAPADPF